MKKIISFASVFLFTTVVLFAQEIKPSVEIFSDFTYDITEGNKDLNSFNIKRAYFGISGHFYRNEESKFSLNFKLTTDISEINDIGKKGKYNVENNNVTLNGSNLNGFYSEFLKYAFIEIENPVIHGIKIVFGQHNVPWVGYEEHMSGMRWLGAVFPDRVKKLSSTDRGISLLYKIPQNFGDMHISIVNGEGYHSPETTKDKDFMLRLSLRPILFIDFMKGLMLHGYYGYGRANVDAQNNDAEGIRKREVLAISYDYDFITLMGEYLRALDGKDTDGNNPVESNGYSIWAKFKLNYFLKSKETGIFIRYDSFDPNENQENDISDLIVVAPYYYLVDGKLGFALQYRSESFENKDAKTNNLIMLNMIGKY